MRYLGLDVGSKNIGISVGEQLAAELTTLTAPANTSFYEEKGMVEAASELKKIIELEQADGIVVGLPVNQNGEPTEESKKITQFGSSLKEHLKIDVHFVDETLTSFMAEEIMESQQVDPARAKERIHQVAAQLILQQYLENNESI